MEQTQGLTDYDEYIMSFREKLLYFLMAAAAVFGVAFIFYHSLLLSAVACLLACFYPGMKTRSLIRQRKYELRLQFRDMLYSLSSSLSAGKSVESAFRELIRDLYVLYPDPDTPLIREVAGIVRKMEMNETIESALADFAQRSHLEDIENFADVFHTCKRTGGNMVEVIRNASNIINDKIEIRMEIDTMLSERKFEKKIMNIMPIMMVLLLSLSAGDYIAPVFNTIAGRVAMTITILLLVLAYFISDKIMDVQV